MKILLNNSILKIASIATLVLGMVIFSGCEKFPLPEAGSLPDATPATAAFSYISSANDFMTVNFANESISATAYAWDFGGGATSTEQDPTYTFAAGEGTYPVTLTATDANGASSSVTVDVVVVDLFVAIEPEIVNGDFSSGQDGWKVSSFTNGTTSPFNASSDGSWLDYTGTNTGAKTPGAKWTMSTSAGEWVSSSTRYAYQAITVSPNTEYILEYEYAIKDDAATDPTGGRRIVGEILNGHFDDGADAVTSSGEGPLVRHIGTNANGKTSFTTVTEEFTSNASGEVSIWIYGVTPKDAYVDNVRVYAK